VTTIAHEQPAIRYASPSQTTYTPQAAVTYAPATNYVSSYQPAVQMEPTFVQDVQYVQHGQEVYDGGYANGTVIYQDGPCVYNQGQYVHQGYVQDPGYITTYGEPVQYVDNGMLPAGYVQQEPLQYVEQGYAAAPPVVYAEPAHFGAETQPMVYAQQPGMQDYGQQPQEFQYGDMPQDPNQSVVKAQVGDWYICEDQQGEFYSHAITGQSYDQPPEELLQLMQQQPQ
jgi:hypothetical protein